MRREAAKTTYGGAPGKPEWRREIANNLDHIATAVTGDSISMDFGYSPSGNADEVRAMIVAAGSGSAAGGDTIHAGPPGRSVWNDDMSGKHPSNAKSEYNLPAAFTQKGNQFVENAIRIMTKEFGMLTEIYMGSIPDPVYYGNVQVSK